MRRVPLATLQDRRQKWINRAASCDRRIAILQRTKAYGDQRIRELDAQIVARRAAEDASR